MKVTDLTELVVASPNDVIPIVDVSEDITKKLQINNLPVPTGVQTALNAKEDLSNKSTSVTTDQASNTKYPSVKAVYDWPVGLFATLTQLATKQDTLVSGTNIKTVNSTSLLGSGDIPIPIVNPSGVAGSIQFSDGSAFASDSNLFWDNTNKRLGVGTNVPTSALHILGNTNTNIRSLQVQNLQNAGILSVTNDGFVQVGDFSLQGYGSSMAFLRPSGASRATTFSQTNSNFTIKNVQGNVTFDLTPVIVKGSGSTSATTALLVQNSGSSNLIEIKDNGECNIGGNTTIARANINLSGSFSGSLNFTTINFANWNGVAYARMTGLDATSGTFIFGGTSINASAKVQFDSTTQGFLPPRMTTTQKNAISSPSSGLQVYDTDLNQMSYYNGSSWINF